VVVGLNNFCNNHDEFYENSYNDIFLDKTCHALLLAAKELKKNAEVKEKKEKILYHCAELLVILF
jgi:hypothetical protein